MKPIPTLVALLMLGVPLALSGAAMADVPEPPCDPVSCGPCAPPGCCSPGSTLCAVRDCAQDPVRGCPFYDVSCDPLVVDHCTRYTTVTAVVANPRDACLVESVPASSNVGACWAIEGTAEVVCLDAFVPQNDRSICASINLVPDLDARCAQPGGEVCNAVLRCRNLDAVDCADAVADVPPGTCDVGVLCNPVACTYDARVFCVVVECAQDPSTCRRGVTAYAQDPCPSEVACGVPDVTCDADLAKVCDAASCTSRWKRCVQDVLDRLFPPCDPGPCPPPA